MCVTISGSALLCTISVATFIGHIFCSNVMGHNSRSHLYRALVSLLFLWAIIELHLDGSPFYFHPRDIAFFANMQMRIIYRGHFIRGHKFDMMFVKRIVCYSIVQTINAFSLMKYNYHCCILQSFNKRQGVWYKTWSRIMNYDARLVSISLVKQTHKWLSEVYTYDVNYYPRGVHS